MCKIPEFEGSGSKIDPAMPICISNSKWLSLPLFWSYKNIFEISKDQKNNSVVCVLQVLALTSTVFELLSKTWNCVRFLPLSGMIFNSEIKIFLLGGRKQICFRVFNDNSKTCKTHPNWNVFLIFKFLRFFCSSKT